MRCPEPHDPEVAAALEAIDATLAGEPVDPGQADLAELSVILRDERPVPDDAVLERLDARVGERFASPAAPRWPPQSADRRRWGWIAGASAAALAALVVAVVVFGGHSGGVSSSSSAASSDASAAPASRAAKSSPGAGASSRGAATITSGSATVPGAAPVPHGGAHRDIAQTAHLTLVASAGRIDSVAQEVFDVVGSERGTVSHSDVHARSAAPSDARFVLRIPSAHLRATLDRLSRLRHARVTSRSDASDDVTGQVNATADQLAQARALRRALLRQLTAAVTTGEIDRARAALRRDAATITRLQGALARVRGRVTDSTITVTVTAPAAQATHHHGSHGGAFTIGRALHDAGRVLVVAAGAALIALAVAVPVGLVAALVAWAWATGRRRRREQALEH